jgi:hypothetical protein
MRTKILKYFGMVVVLIIMVNLTSCEVSIESWYDDDDYSEIYYRTTRELCSRTWQETWEQDGPVSDESRKKMSDKASGKNNAMYGRCAYDIWVEKFGKEEADRRKEELRKKQSENSKRMNEQRRLKKQGLL